jgi:hypothetical protein
MPLDSPKFDVAVSFLAKDEPIAAALHEELRKGLNVFFYPRSQEDLAGTDGMESMRMAFLDDCRVMVVLYREGWGKTRWTAIEETAIKEACFNGGWNRLFFINLDRASVLPKWLPEYHVRYNWEDFGLDQCVGAIKARVLENGGQPTPLTARKRAEILQAEDIYRADRSQMNSAEGLKLILAEVRALFARIVKGCEEVSALGHLQVRCETDFKDRSAQQMCVLTDDRVGMTLIWHQRYSNLLEDSGLYVREFNGG